MPNALPKYWWLVVSIVSGDQIIVKFILQYAPQWLRGNGQAWLGTGDVVFQALLPLIMVPAYYLLPRGTVRQTAAGWVILTGGWLSNFISLIRLQGYPDFIPYGPFYTNTADLCICAGAAVIVWSAVRGLKKP